MSKEANKETKIQLEKMYEEMDKYSSRMNEEALDKIYKTTLELAHDPEVEMSDDKIWMLFVQVSCELTILYKKIGKPSMAMTTGTFFLNLCRITEAFQYWFDSTYIDSYKQQLKAVDCYIDSFLETGNGYGIPSDRKEKLREISDALYPLQLNGESQVDNLKRLLNVCLVILSFSNDETSMVRYLESFHQLEKTIQDKDTLAKYKPHAESIAAMLYPKTVETLDMLANDPFLSCFFGINTKFSKELIQSFTTVVTKETDKTGFPIITYRSGFTKGGELTGFVWTRRFEPPHFSNKYEERSEWGIVDTKEQVYTSEGTQDDPNDLPIAGNYMLWGYSKDVNFPSELLVKVYESNMSNKNDLLVYCGMHKGGIFHGLGSRFLTIGKDRAELPGLWQDGKLTHLKVNDKLVPIFEPECRADAEGICKILGRIAKLDDIKPELAMSWKQLSKKLMEPFE